MFRNARFAPGCRENFFGVLQANHLTDTLATAMYISHHERIALDSWARFL